MSGENEVKVWTKLHVAIAIESEISVGLMEKLCKAVREKWGDTAKVYVLERENGDNVIRVYGEEEVEV